MLKYILALSLFFCAGCLDVVRGYKSIIYIYADNGAILFIDGAEVSVEADKQYSDMLKTTPDAAKGAAEKAIKAAITGGK